LSDSEIISILIFFHFGFFTNFKHYYNHYVKIHLSDCFPNLFFVLQESQQNYGDIISKQFNLICFF
jgi:hypothetical protein